MKKVYAIAIIGFILVFLAQVGMTAEPPSHDPGAAHTEDAHDEGAHLHRSWMSPLSKFLPDSIVPEPHRWEQPDLIPNTYFVLLVVALLFIISTRKIKPLPEGKGQTLLEFFVGTLIDFFGDILGPDGRKYVPFVGSYFILILSLNYLGLIPGFQSPTAHLNTTLALGVTAVLGVQIIAIKENGVLGYLKHLRGDPPGPRFSNVSAGSYRSIGACRLTLAPFVREHLWRRDGNLSTHQARSGNRHCWHPVSTDSSPDVIFRTVWRLPASPCFLNVDIRLYRAVCHTSP